MSLWEKMPRSFLGRMITQGRGDSRWISHLSDSESETSAILLPGCTNYQSRKHCRVLADKLGSFPLAWLHLLVIDMFCVSYSIYDISTTQGILTCHVCLYLLLFATSINLRSGWEKPRRLFIWEGGENWHCMHIIKKLFKKAGEVALWLTGTCCSSMTGSQHPQGLAYNQGTPWSILAFVCTHTHVACTHTNTHIYINTV
jgi:hypothetical protein